MTAPWILVLCLLSTCVLLIALVVLGALRRISAVLEHWPRGNGDDFDMKGVKVEADEQRTSRRSFLRRLGITLAAGVGVAAFPGTARGGSDGLFECCASEAHCPELNCQAQGLVKWWCDCGGSSYCVCRTSGGNCQPAQC